MTRRPSRICAPDGVYSVDLDVSGWPDDQPADQLVVRRSAGLRSVS